LSSRGIGQGSICVSLPPLVNAKAGRRSSGCRHSI
jgi:hypothetical protein